MLIHSTLFSHVLYAKIRFAQIHKRSVASNNLHGGREIDNEVIDKAAFFKSAEEKASGVAKLPPPTDDDDEERLWSPKTIRTVPAFYPLEKSSRFIEDDHLAVASRLAECCRVLSVQATYNGGGNRPEILRWKLSTRPGGSLTTRLLLSIVGRRYTLLVNAHGAKSSPHLEDSPNFETEPLATNTVLQVHASIRVRAHQSITSVGLDTRRGGHAHGSPAEQA